MLTQYGLIPDEAWALNAMTYAFARGRGAQDSSNIYTCLAKTLTNEATSAVRAEQHIYCLQSPASSAPGTIPFNDGLMFLKVIIGQASIVTNASLSMIIQRLSEESLKNKIKELASDIKEFNTYVNANTHSYNICSRVPFDPRFLFTNVMEAYLQTEENDFVTSMKLKGEEHDDGARTYTVAKIMSIAFRLFNKRKERSMWMEKTKEQKQIVTLTATINNMRSNGGKFNKPKAKTKGSKSKGSNTNKSSSKSNKTPTQRRKERYDASPAWMKKAPTDGKGVMTKDGKTYYWCPSHKLWQLHKPSEYRLKQKLIEESNKRLKADKVVTVPVKKVEEDEELELDATLATIIEEEDALDYDIKD